MKISIEHFLTMENAIKAVISTNEAWPMFKDQLDKQMVTGKRYRWDMLRAANINGKNGITWICDNLYSYLDDTHIDTALRNITHTK